MNHHALHVIQHLKPPTHYSTPSTFIVMPPFSFFFLLLFLQLSSSLIPPQPFPYVNTSFHIDCGGSSTTVDPTSNTTWLSDRFFSGGSAAVVSEPLRFILPHEKTLRYFPISSGKKNCYIVPDLPSGRYYIRTFTAYDNYDGRSHSPSFDASVEGTLVFSWRSPWSEDAAQSGAYSDLFAYVTDGEADICFYSVATDVPVIGSLSIVRVDPLSYDSVSVGNRSILVNYGRLDCGSGQWGPGFTNDTDYFGRSWQSDSNFRSAFSETFIDTLTTQNSISGTNQQPNYFPMKLYQTAVTVSQGDLEYELDVDAKVDYLLWFHFAEIDSNVNAQGKRVFDIVVNERNVTRIDIYKEVGLYAAYGWHYTVKNLSTNALRVKLVSVVGAPLICALENYALVPADLSTDPQQVIAMRALKESLQVPERMGWNGDPCAPTDWDAWEGISCRPNKDQSYLVISQIDLASQGLKGSISGKISLLTNLASLNLSHNSLEGIIPSGLGLKSLVQLDLSHNQLAGYIPDSLTSSGLQLVLLNDNLLEGRVPVELYSIGVHGGVVDVSGNKALCGMQPLPSCSMLWDDGGISSGGRVAIGLSSVVGFTMLLLLIYVCYIRRRRSDYGFGFPQDLMAIAAKRNKYQRQKSLMVLELESQHAKGFPSPFIHR